MASPIAKKCYELHLPLPIPQGGQTLQIYGGSCWQPVVKDADIYVDLDRSVNFKMAYPWRKGFALYFPIVNLKPPSSKKDFEYLIRWLGHELAEGRKIHVGCIGGHGRTGLVFAALVRHLMPDLEDPIGYVRENYCNRAVETQEQIDWLVANWACKPVDPVAHYAKVTDKDRGPVTRDSKRTFTLIEGRPD